jgi:TonB-linked SusC/RagA family outer membrane protein
MTVPVTNCSRKSRNLVWLLWGICFFCLPSLVAAQELAFSHPVQGTRLPGNTENTLSLKNVLSEISARYAVSFNYDADVVQHLVVSEGAKPDFKENFDKSLDALLEPLGLKFRKVEKNIYIIFPAGRSIRGAEIKHLPQSSGGTAASSSVMQLISLKQIPAAITVSGKVTSQENNEALPGVNVLVKGTNIGAVTNVDGDYTISAPDGNGTLVFSYIGFTPLEVPINNRSTIDVKLAPDVKALGEVVVTALGIQKETKKLGYAVASVSPEQITVNRTTNFMNALQGKMAGVNITSLGTGPAGTSKIRIRGQSSFGGQNNPLIVVNGIPINNANQGYNPNSADNSNGVGGVATRSDGGDGLSSINPDDIESMTVLKGGPAAALYGARAKDGVIMITTKNKGAQQGIGIEYNTNFTTDTPLDFTDFQYEYGQGEGGKRPTAANPTSGVWSFGERFQPGMTQILFDGVEVPYEPVRDRIRKFYRVGNTWTNTITLSSGGEKGGFSLSLSNLDTKSIVPNSDFNRKTINLGFTQTILSKLTISGNVNYSNEYNRNPPSIADQDLSTPTTIYTLANSMPLDLLEQKRLDANGNEFVYSRFRNRTNPFFAVYNRFENIRRDRVFGNITARYNFTDWLYLQGRIGQDFFARDQEYNIPTGMASLSAPPAGFVNGQYAQQARRFREINADFLLGASRTFGRFGIDATFGGNQMYQRTDQNSVAVTNFVVRGLYTARNGQQKNPFYDLFEKQVNSLYGSAEFSYNDVLFVNMTARNDWFSTLSPANRSILYPSVTGSFVFSQAFAGLPDWLSFGKIRAGYAEVGSDLDVAPYSNNLFYDINANLFPNTAGLAVLPLGNIATNTVPNLALKPMRVSEKEFGLDIRLFNNRIGLDVAYYDKLTTDQIVGVQVSDASGYTGRLINVGESRNNGVEMLLNLTPVKTAGFQWDFSFNGSYNTTKILKLGPNPGDTVITVGRGIFEGELRQVVGKPIGQLYAYGYKTINGQRVFDATSGRPIRTDNQVAFGTAIPRWVGGFTNTFNYKGINLSFLIDFKLGHKMISATNFNAWRHGLHKGTLPGREENSVVGVGVNPNGEVNTTGTETAQIFYETVRSANLLGEFVYNAGFWKLRQITLGYDFTKLLPQNFFVKGVRLNAVANNVAILKKWVPNIDPESFGFSSDNLVGLEATGLPTTRSVGFNLNVKF